MQPSSVADYQRQQWSRRRGSFTPGLPRQARVGPSPLGLDPFAVDPADDPPTGRGVPSSTEAQFNQQVSNEPVGFWLSHGVHINYRASTWYLTVRYRENVIHIAGQFSSMMHQRPSATLSRILQASRTALQGDMAALRSATVETMRTIIPQLAERIPEPHPGLHTLYEFLAARHIWSKAYATPMGTLRVSNRTRDDSRELTPADFPPKAQMGWTIFVSAGDMQGLDGVPRIDLHDYDVIDGRDVYSRQTIVVRERAAGPTSPLLIFKPARDTRLFLEGLTVHVAVHEQMRTQPGSALKCFAVLKGIACDHQGLVIGYLVEGTAGATALPQLQELPSLEKRKVWMDDILAACMELFAIGYTWGWPRPDGVMIDGRGEVRLRGLHGPFGAYMQGINEIRDSLGINDQSAQPTSPGAAWPALPSGDEHLF